MQYAYMHTHDCLHIAHACMHVIQQLITCAVIKARSIAMNQSGSVQFDGGAAANITVSIPESIVHRGTGTSAYCIVDVCAAE